MKVLPAAEAAAGELNEADADIQHTIAHLDDVTDSGEGEVAEMLRPFYLEYLRKHNVKPTLGQRAKQRREQLDRGDRAGDASATTATSTNPAACAARRATSRPAWRSDCGSRRSVASSSIAPSRPAP